MRYAWSAVVLALLNPCLVAHDEEIYVAIEFSTAQKEQPQDWSGKLTVENGELKKVFNTAGGADTINQDGTWDLIYGRQAKPGTTNPNGYMRKGIAIQVLVSADTILKFATKGGDFTVNLGDLEDSQPHAYLDGKVTVQIVEAPDQILPIPGQGKQAAAQGQGGGGGWPKAPTQGDLATRVISDVTTQADFPAVAVAGDMAVAAWVEWREDHDVLRLRAGQGQEWGETQEFSAGGTDIYQPVLVTVAQQVICLWPERVNDDIDLFAAPVYPKLGQPVRLTAEPGADFDLDAVALPGGKVGFCFMSWRGGDGNVWYGELDSTTVSPLERVSPSPANDWEPSLAATVDGTVTVAWDSYAMGNYDIQARRRMAEGRWQEAIAITGGAGAEFHADVAVDSRGRAWIAYDQAGAKWGKDFGRSYKDPDPAVAKGLHDRRTLGLRVLDGDAVLAVPNAFAKFGRPMDQFAERPELKIDGRGTPWIVFRHWTQRKPTEIFEEYAARLGADGFELPFKLDGPTGRNSQDPGVAVLPDGGLLLACAGDGRAPGMKYTAQVESPSYRIHIGRTEPPPPAADIMLEPAPAQPVETDLDTRPRQVQISIGGQRYTLLYGDCHRHTDIRGHGAVDGSVVDTFRYAIDAARLDYTATTDHNDTFGGDWLDGLRPYQWWWTQKAAELYHHPPQFVGMFAYEHSLSPPAGHRNVIFPNRRGRESLRRADRRLDEDNPPPKLWQFLEGIEPALDVPHTFAEGSQPHAEWNWPNPPVEPLLEIYQGARSSYEVFGAAQGEQRGGSQEKQGGHFAQDALNAGCKYGFVSFSDHGSTHQSYAAIWAKEISRMGIWQGMRDRRTFAASDDMILDCRIGEQPMGTEFKLAGAPRVSIDVNARTTIRRVDVIRNGEVVYTARPEAASWQGMFEDNQPAAGDSYYYVRVIQEDPEQPAGDPEMAWGSPFFVRQ